MGEVQRVWTHVDSMESPVFPGCRLEAARGRNGVGGEGGAGAPPAGGGGGGTQDTAGAGLQPSGTPEKDW